MKHQLMCIYHANCCDGMGAAWSVHHALKNTYDIEFVAATYQTEPPEVAGKNVVIVDFSYKRDVIAQMAKVANSITVIDHHKTAEAELAPLLKSGAINGVFDMTKSGAMLTWEYFHGEETPPRLIEHIQDRDLWKFELVGTREIQAALYSYPMEFDVWDKLMFTHLDDLYKEGVAIDRAHLKNVDGLVEFLTHRQIIAGYDVPAVNCPYMFASDVGNKLATNEPFSVTYYDTEDNRKYSLRSVEGGVDVSEVAALFGGGGHKHAAGFKIPLDRINEVSMVPTAQ
jgi:oligoribonuclease NrnB/cAMP/cGMP phosphodiesterase (DHH superfamily)